MRRRRGAHLPCWIVTFTVQAMVHAVGRAVPRNRLKKMLLAGGVGVAVVALLVVGGLSLWGSSKPPSNAHTSSGCSAAPGQKTGQAAASSKIAPDLTLSFDAEPAYCEWDGIQPGYECVDHAVDRAVPTNLPSAAFVRDDTPGNVRDGKYSAKVVLRSGDHTAYTCKAESVGAIKDIGEAEGSQSWWGWSWKLPVGWRGTDSWGMLFQFTVNAFYWPSYGMLNFDASSRDSLQLNLHTGLTPNPGSGTYNAAYEKSVTLLGPATPRRMVYGKWLDFYMHVVWRSHTSGLLEIWYRVAGQSRFTKLYSDVPGGGALIQVPPHPTLLYNTENGAPGDSGKPGLQLIGGFYRGDQNVTNTYWWDGMRRRRSEAAILAGFPAPALPPSSTSPQ
jgi:Polysaccharide lyase